MVSGVPLTAGLTWSQCRSGRATASRWQVDALFYSVGLVSSAITEAARTVPTDLVSPDPGCDPSGFRLCDHLSGLSGRIAGPASISPGATGCCSSPVPRHACASTANVVTAGVFATPSMKKFGYTAVKAGATEVAASVNGQLMPPIMGAAAFILASSSAMILGMGLPTTANAAGVFHASVPVRIGPGSMIGCGCACQGIAW